MNVAFIANIRLPTEKAHGYAIMRTCAAWRTLGHDVTLYVPGRANYLTEDAFLYYGLEKTFQVVFVPCTDWMRYTFLGPFAFVLQNLSFLSQVAKQLSKDAVIYTREELTAWYFGRRAVWNPHTVGKRTFLLRFFGRNVAGIVCLSRGVEDDVRRILKTPTVISRSGTDPNPYRGKDKKELRRELELPEDAHIALYAGHLYEWKGPDVIIKAAALLKGENIQFVILGGTPADIERYRRRIEEEGLSNVALLGHKKKEFVPKYHAAADALLLPNLATEAISARHTSPLKLYEYMAAGVPIIASDLPSMRETLGDGAAYFFPAGDAHSLATTLRHVFSHGHEARNRAQQALLEVEQYSWEAQAKIAADFTQSLISKPQVDKSAI